MKAELFVNIFGYHRISCNFCLIAYFNICADNGNIIAAEFFVFPLIICVLGNRTDITILPITVFVPMRDL